MVVISFVFSSWIINEFENVSSRSCEVFPNSRISPLVLSYGFGIFLLYDKLRFPFDIIKMLWSNTAAETERKMGEGLVAKIALNSVEKGEGPCWIQQQYWTNWADRSAVLRKEAMRGDKLGWCLTSGKFILFSFSFNQFDHFVYSIKIRWYSIAHISKWTIRCALRWWRVSGLN